MEVGVWKNFDELEESLCLDELFLLYDKIIEKIKRSAALAGADFGDEPEHTAIKGPVVGDDGTTLFGYKQSGG